MKRALIINGSLRAGGNSDQIIASLVAGAKRGETSIVHYILRNHLIRDCVGFYFCYRNSECALDDEMKNIHREIQSADVLILASPLYWWGVTGLMKTFIDRLYLYYPRRNAKLIAGKKAIILTPMHVNEKEHGKEAYESEIEPITLTYGHILKRLGIEILDMVFFPGVGKKGEARKNAAYIEGASKLGEQIGTL